MQTIDRRRFNTGLFLGVGLAGCAQLPPGAPDLIVTGMRWSEDDGATWHTGTIQAGSNVWFEADVKNQGTGPTPDGVIIGVGFRANGTLVAWSDDHTTALPAGQAVSLRANGGPDGDKYWNNAASGSHTIRAHVDDVDRIPDELDESNNTLNVQVTVESRQQVSDTPFETSWIGCTLPGLDTPVWLAHIQHNCFAAWIAPDGRVFCNTVWDESTNECGVYQNGENVGRLLNIHNGGGGNGIGGNGTYMFSAVRSKQSSDYGLCRHGQSTYDPVDITGGPTRAGYNNYRPAGGPIYGITVVGSEVFASVKNLNRVEVYNTSNLNFLRSFLVTAPDNLVADAQNRIWVITNNEVRAYNTSGTYLGLAITDVVDPSALGRDWTNPNVILVADDAETTQQVYIYDITSTPTRVETIGAAKGIWAGPSRGAVGELRFAHITGVGIDSSGALYVVQDHRTHEEKGAGTNIDVYVRSGGAWARLWQALGLFFIDVCDIDMSTYQPGQPLDVYSSCEHFKLDPSQPPGQQWTWVGHTTDSWNAPTDKRLNKVGASSHDTPDQVLNIVTLDGRKFLAGAGMWSGALYFYTPVSGSETWRQAYTLSFGTSGEGHLADNGDVWMTTFATSGSPIRQYPYTGLDASNNPTYGALVTYPLPTGFNLVKRVRYDPSTDTLFVAGFTPEHPAWTEMDKTQGTTLGRIDNWAAGNRTPAWMTVIPHDRTKTISGTPKEFVGTISFDVAADRVYIVALNRYGADTQPRTWVYNIDTGVEVANFVPGSTLGLCGWVDVFDGIRARKLPNGEVVLFIEEDAQCKNIIMRINRGP